jgi:hypothetical protein
MLWTAAGPLSRIRRVLPAVSWDNKDPYEPSVLGRLRLRTKDMAGDDVQCTPVALLFAQPTVPAIAAAAQDKEYFDARTLELWDLFFAGYFRYPLPDYDPAGIPLTNESDGPWFSARDFNSFRQDVETRSAGRWVYSGDVDLVLINVFLVPGDEPVVDWDSAVSRSLVDANGRYVDLSLGGVIEAISRGIERGYASPSWNLPSAQAVRKDPSALSGVARETLSAVLAGVVTGLI